MKTKLIFAVALCAAAVRADVEWEDPQVNSINREPARTYTMPLASENAALTDALEPETPYRMSLNGDWKFHWCGEPAQRPLDFWKVDYDDSKWSVIDVPSCVEMRGWGRPGYVNVRYPHPNTPPKITGDHNPVSSYRTTFAVPAEWKGREVYLRFDGVYSAYYVWVNGQKVGYAEDSKLPSEFNVTRYLRDGGNVLAVEVYRWSDGSYLEDQDMFRFSGIFRDVTLFAAPKDGIRDFVFTSEIAPDWKSAKLKLSVEAGAPWSAKLYDARHEFAGEFKDGVLELPAAHLWSAEDPYLYTLVMTAGSDIRARRVGIRKVEIVGNAILFNGRKIKFKGVNRHESNPENGRTVSLDDMLRDITLFKQFNINTVRTCHYPDHHSWYDLCDRFGIYMVAEANVESHGAGGYNEYDKCLGYLDAWTKPMVERNENNVRNYRNNPAVFMWSLGNECGAGKNFVAARDAVKRLDGTRPVHYEGYNEAMDVDSRMYPEVEWLERRGKFGDGEDQPDIGDDWAEGRKHTKGKAFFMCEYAHAMGNAIGNFAEYWDVFYRYDSLSGGCIWDWIDQAVWKDTDRVGPDGRRVRYLAYGGDFDEQPNDGPFCCNGVIGPTREVTPKLVEVGHVHRNLVVTSADAATGEAELWNRFGFTDASEFEGRWELVSDGVRLAAGTFEVPSVAPLSRAKIRLPRPDYDARVAGECFYNVSFHLKEDTIWAKAGHCIARDQLPFTPGPASSSDSPKSIWMWTDWFASRTVEVRETDKTLEVFNGNFKAVFCRRSGTLCELELDGRTILKDRDGVVAGPRLTCERAFTDNDVWMRQGGSWSRDDSKSFYGSGLTQLSYHASPLSVSVAEGNESATVKSTVTVNGSKTGGFVHEMEWTLRADGLIRMKNKVVPFGRIPVLPRLGLSWTLDPALERMTWYGRGPGENYVDRNSGSFVGRYESTVAAQYVDYVRPQDCGYKSDVRWVALTNGRGKGVAFRGVKTSKDELTGLVSVAMAPMFVQALHYGMEDLEFARHRNGQERIWNPPTPREEVFLNTDVLQTGLGGASCGPAPMEKYRVKVEPVSWELEILPGSDTDRLRSAPLSGKIHPSGESN